MNKIALLALSLALLGCNAPPAPELRIAKALQLAEGGGMKAEIVETAQFDLMTFHRGLGQSQDWHVYVEGDGLAFVNRYRRSNDPTPVTPTTLELALRDRAKAILVVARPCQYVLTATSRACDPDFWTSSRFAPEVLSSMREAVAHYAKGNAPRLTLFGYSGGGVLATLWAAEDKRVERLTTIAAPLDVSFWADHHQVSPLTGSLDPANLAKSIQAQELHLVGEGDPVVPPEVVESYIHARGSSERIRMQIIPKFDHSCCWIESWPGLLTDFRGSFLGDFRLTSR